MFRSILTAAVFITLFGTVLPFPVLAVEDPVVATVNGESIRRSDLEEARTRLPDSYRQVPLEAVSGILVKSLIDTKLMATEARKAGLENDPVFKARLARIKEQLLERIYLTGYIQKQITKEKLDEAYAKLRAEAAKKKEVRARHILLKTEKEARAVIAEIKNGADFAELAKKKSIGPSSSQGGDLGYFAEGRMVPEFSKAAFAMNKGEVTETPVKTQFGWHVIKVEDKRTAAAPSFEEVKKELSAKLARGIGSAYLNGLRNKAKIENFNLDGSPLEKAGK